MLTLYSGNSNEDSSGTLVIHSRGFNNEKGKAMVFIYRKTDKIPDRPYRIEYGTIKDNKAHFAVEDLPFDEYAIILLHDENDNDKIDHSRGVPDKQLGYSNNWTLGLFSGMPTFSRLKFAFSLSTPDQTIDITYKN